MAGFLLVRKTQEPSCILCKMSGRRQAPKRAIIAINKIGPWGSVRYEHQLECGHSELLPRASSAKRLACSICKSQADVAAEKTAIDKREMTATKETIIPSSYFDARLDFEDSFSEDELLVRRVAAEIASLLDIPVDAVSVNTDASSGRLIITSAYVFLSAKDLSRLTNVRG